VGEKFVAGGDTELVHYHGGVIRKTWIVTHRFSEGLQFEHNIEPASG
jgi:hypothetical protein